MLALGKVELTLSLNLPLIAASSAHILTFARMKCLDGLKRLTQSSLGFCKGEKHGEAWGFPAVPCVGPCQQHGAQEAAYGRGLSHSHAVLCVTQTQMMMLLAAALRAVLGSQCGKGICSPPDAFLWWQSLRVWAVNFLTPGASFWVHKAVCSSALLCSVVGSEDLCPVVLW